MNVIYNKSTRVPIQILLSFSFCHSLLSLKLAAGFHIFCQGWGGMVPRDNLPRDNVPVPQVNQPRRQCAPGRVVSRADCVWGRFSWSTLSRGTLSWGRLSLGTMSPHPASLSQHFLMLSVNLYLLTIIVILQVII